MSKKLCCQGAFRWRNNLYCRQREATGRCVMYIEGRLLLWPYLPCLPKKGWVCFYPKQEINVRCHVDSAALFTSCPETQQHYVTAPVLLPCLMIKSGKKINQMPGHPLDDIFPSFPSSKAIRWQSPPTQSISLLTGWGLRFLRRPWGSWEWAPLATK